MNKLHISSFGYDFYSFMRFGFNFQNLKKLKHLSVIHKPDYILNIKLNVYLKNNILSLENLIGQNHVVKDTNSKSI